MANLQIDAPTDPEPDSRAGTLEIETTQADPRWQPLQAGLLAHAALVWAELALPAAELSLTLTDDAAIAALNETYRQRPGPTNVLSFPAYDFAAPIDADGFPAPPVLLGDVVLAYDTLAREAAAGPRALQAHAAHLLTHGVLHLLGHDHQTEAEAHIMERLETQLMAAAGLPDPYAGDAGAGAAQ